MPKHHGLQDFFLQLEAGPRLCESETPGRLRVKHNLNFQVLLSLHNGLY